MILQQNERKNKQRQRDKRTVPGVKIKHLLCTGLLMLALVFCFCLSGGLTTAQADEVEEDEVYVTFDTFEIQGWELFSDEACTNSLGQVGRANAVTDPGTAKLEKVSGNVKGYLKPGTYWVKGEKSKSGTKTPYTVKITIPSGVETFRVSYYQLSVRLSMQSVTTSLTDAGLSVDDYCLGGTAVLKRSDGTVLPWTFQYDVTEGKEPHGQGEWYYKEQKGSENEYTLTYTPLDENFSSVERTVHATGTPTCTLLSQWQWIRTFRIPAEYKDLFHLYQKTGNHYTPFTELTPLSVGTVVDGYVDFSYALPQQCSVHYTIDHSDELGNIKLSRTRSFHRGIPSLWVERGYSKVREDYISGTGLWSDNWVSFDLDNSLRLNISAAEDANLYLNVDDSNYVTLDTGETTKLEAFRTWQAVTDVIGNYFIEPDFHYEIIGDSVSIEEKGDEGRRYVDVTAGQNGLSVIKVTYDAMYFAGVGATAEYWAEGENSRYYDAIEPVNTRVVIVNVGATNTANIQPNIEQTEYDTIYFDDSKTDHAEYTFTPTADEGHTLRVRVHDPLHNTDWDTAWTTYTAALDGSYTVDLKDGRNIIEISAEDGSVEYYVVNCRALDIDIVNLTRPDATDYQQGDTIQIYFDGLTMPVQKMAGIYNPNFPDQGWVEYHTEDGDTVRSAGAQYSAVTRSGSKLTIELTEAGEYHLLNGQIHNTHLGSSLNTHRIIPLTGMSVNINASSGENSPYFSTLPDIRLTVKETPGYVPPKKAAVNAVIALIDAIGDVTIDSKDAIEAARNAYAALDEEQQAAVTNYDKLVAAEAAYAALEQPEAPKGDDEVTVTLNVSYGDDIYAPTKTGAPIAQATLTVPYFDLAQYGLTAYYYNPDCYQGTTQTAGTSASADGKVTLLHALIYATEVLYEGIGESNAGKGWLYEEGDMDAVFHPTGSAGSLYFNPLWNFGYNLNYYVNYEYPIGKEGTGATADQILLADGDVISLHGISQNSTATGTIFPYLRLSGVRDHATLMQGNTAVLRLYHAKTASDFNGTTYTAGTKEKVYITSVLTEDISEWTEVGTTDATGALSLDTSELDIGTYYIATAGFNGIYQTAPAVFVLAVTENPDKVAADKVIALIDAIGEVTLKSGDAIRAAREAYNGLSDAQKELVTNYQTLVDAEKAYDELPVIPVVPGTPTAPSKPSTPAVPEAPSFTDISGHWATDAIEYAVANGLMNGTGNGLFSPNANTTRGMIVTILARLEGVDTSKGGNWYEAGQQWAMKLGISDGTNMDGQITREQLATMLYRYAQIKGYDVSTSASLNAFTDASSVSDWAVEAMQWAVGMGLMEGNNNQLSPTAPATRAQVATLLMRFIEKLAK